MPPSSYAIALGSNRRHGRHGGPARVIDAAIDAMAAAGLRIDARSPIFATAAIGPAGRAFANAAVLVSTDLPPPALLHLLKRLERDFGRRPGLRWGARVLDLDILLWSGGCWPRWPRAASMRHRLGIPHYALADRRFVLDPLSRIAPLWRDPRSARTVRQIRARHG